MEVNRNAALLLALLAVLAPVVGVVAIGPATAAPSGMVTISDSQIDSELPPNTPMGDVASRLKDAGVLTTAHAETLSVTVTNPGRAKKYTDGSVFGGGPVAIVLTDDVNDEGRQVAIPKAVLKDTLGYVPDAAYGTHEDGSRWMRQTQVEGDYVLVSVPHFSSNTVTFSGEYSLQAQPASDGTSYQYDIDDLDAADNFTVDLTGSTATESETTSRSGLTDGDSLSVDAAGNLAPTGAEVTLTGAPEGEQWNISAADDDITDVEYHDGVVYTGSWPDNNVSAWDADTGELIWSRYQGSYGDIAVDDTYLYLGTGEANLYALHKSNGTEAWSVSHGTNVEAVAVDDTYVYNGDYNGEIYAYYKSNGSQQWSYTQLGGTTEEVASDGDNVYATSENSDVHAVDISTESQEWTYTDQTSAVEEMALGGNRVLVGGRDHDIDALDPSTGSRDWRLSVGADVRALAATNQQFHFANQSTEFHTYRLTDQSFVQSYSESWSVKALEADGATVYGGYRYGPLQRVGLGSTDPSVTVDGDTVSYTGTMNGGETHSESISLSTGSHTADVSVSGAVDVQIDWTERTQTVDPAVEVNGNTTRYKGSLSDGSTATLSTNTSWLQSSTNRVNISVGDGTLSADAPTPQVDLNYSHGLTDRQTVTYASEQWTDRYNVSKQFASDRDQAELLIPYESQVLAISGLKARVNGTTWNPVADSDYTLSGNDLTVDLDAVYGGPIPASTEIEVRANGSKVKPHNVSLTVLNATDMGSTLDSKIRIDSTGSNAYIEVGNTSMGDRLHYLYDESWAGASDYAVVEADGRQALHLPNAEGGDTAQVTFVNTQVLPKSGDVRVAVESGGALPTFDVSPGPGGEHGSEVVFTHYDTVSGQKYLLYSTTNGIVRDSATASSPVLLTDDDSDETLEIQEDDGNTSSDSDGDTSDPPVIGQFTNEDGGANIPLIIAALGAVLALLALVQWQTGTNPLTTAASGATDAGSMLAARPKALAAVIGLAFTASLALGIVAVPESVFVVLVVGGVAVASYFGLQRAGQFSVTRWAAILAVTALAAFSATGELSAIFGALGTSGSAIAVIGLLYLGYRALKSAGQPDKVQRFIFRGGS
ncbi:PQQ-binding-like beta-propeller repeat protein [Halobacteriales archaeon Cl-PHB]